MARPKRRPGVPTAKEAIEEQFWRLYTEKPLERISVKEVCEAAGCNKTTFYYHFQDLRAVLDSIEEATLPTEAPDLLAGLIMAQDKAAFIAGFIESMGERFERYCILLSSKGDPDFAKRSKDVMADRWCKKLGIQYDELSDTARMSIRFAMGGAASIFADHGEGESFDADAFAETVLTMAAPLLELVSRQR